MHGAAGFELMYPENFKIIVSSLHKVVVLTSALRFRSAGPARTEYPWRQRLQEAFSRRACETNRCVLLPVRWTDA